MTVYDERVTPTSGEWRPVVREMADKFMVCGILEHGFARIRCDGCTQESLLAFSYHCGYLCPSCHAKRLALLEQRLDTTLLASVPLRQVMLSVPKRLRAFCLFRRHLLGDIARVAAPTVRAAVRALTARRARWGPSWPLEHSEGSEPVAGGIAVPLDDAPAAVGPASQTAHRSLTRRQNPEYAYATAIECPIPPHSR